MFRVDAVLLGMRPQPANGRLAILDLRGKGGVPAKAVLEAGRGVAQRDEAADGILVLGAAAPSPPMYPGDERAGSAGLLGKIEVDLLITFSPSPRNS